MTSMGETVLVSYVGVALLFVCAGPVVCLLEKRPPEEWFAPCLGFLLFALFWPVGLIVLLICAVLEGEK